MELKNFNIKKELEDNYFNNNLKKTSKFGGLFI